MSTNSNWQKAFNAFVNGTFFDSKNITVNIDGDCISYFLDGARIALRNIKTNVVLIGYMREPSQHIADHLNKITLHYGNRITKYREGGIDCIEQTPTARFFTLQQATFLPLPAKYLTADEAKKQGDSITNQKIKRQFIGQHVYSCVTSMVEYILTKSYDDSEAPFSHDDITNAYNNYTCQYSPDGNREQIQFEGTREERDELIEQLRDKVDELEGILQAHENAEDKDENTDADDLQDRVDELKSSIDQLEECEGEPYEIYEWWIVSRFLSEKLIQYGQPVLKNDEIWGRCTTGQAILLDYVITEICADMGILEGQENSWASKK